MACQIASRFFSSATINQIRQAKPVAGFIWKVKAEGDEEIGSPEWPWAKCKGGKVKSKSTLGDTDQAVEMRPSLCLCPSVLLTAHLSLQELCMWGPGGDAGFSLGSCQASLPSLSKPQSIVCLRFSDAQIKLFCSFVREKIFFVQHSLFKVGFDHAYLYVSMYVVRKQNWTSFWKA